MAYRREPTDSKVKNKEIEQYYHTYIDNYDTTIEDDSTSQKLSKITGGLKPCLDNPEPKAGPSDDQYARHDRKPARRDVSGGDVNAQLYNACLDGDLNIIKGILNTHRAALTPDAHGQTPLFAACIGNQTETIEILIAHGYDVNHQDNDGKTPLHLAFEWDHVKIAELLMVQFKASTSKRDHRRWTPIHVAIDRRLNSFASILQRFYNDDIGTDVSWLHLHAACYSGDLRKVQHLLEMGTDVNHTSSLGYTPLHVACRANKSHIVKYLLDHGAWKAVHQACAQGLQPLHLATPKASHDIIKLLLKYCADPNAVGNKSQTAFHIAVAANNSETLKLLIAKCDADLSITDAAGDTCLHRAVFQRSQEMVSVLLQKNVDVNGVNFRCLTPLHLAILKDEPVIVEKLLAAGADPNVQDIDGDNSLLLAIHQDHEDLVEMLLEAGAQVLSTNDDGNTCLHRAILKRFSIQTINALLLHGAPVDAKNKKDQTALLFAIQLDNLALTELLLKSGADTNVCDKHGQSVLHWAVDSSSREIIQTLLNHGARLDCKDVKGRTPFLLACQSGELDKMKLMLDAGSDPSILEKDGDTALHNAIHARCGRDVVEALISHGVAVDAVNRKCKTALALACMSRQNELVKVLLEAGADPNIADYHGNTSLHNAVYYKCSIDTLHLLAEHGADLNAMNKDSMTALLLGCKHLYKAESLALLSLGADPNIADEEGETVLHWAVQEGLGTDFIQSLLKCNAFVDAVDLKKRTALMLACSKRDLQSLDILLKASTDTNIADHDGDTVLHRAVHKRCCDIETFQKIIDHGADLDKLNYASRTALWLACISKQTEVAALLLNSGANPNLGDGDGDNCLHIATWKGNLQLVQMLLSQRININAENHKQFTALYIACAKGNAEIAKVLMTAGADVNRVNHRHNVALHKAIKTEQLTIVADLLQHGANVNAKGQHNLTPLHVAVTLASKEFTEILLKYDPEVNAQCSKGETALHIACRMKHHRQAELLLHHGADTTHRDHSGHYALEHAVLGCDLSLLEIFAKHDRSILNTDMGPKQTPLHYYCRIGDGDMVDWLLAYGVDKDKSCGYTTPLDVAFDNRHKNIVLTLIDAGANVSISSSAFRFSFLEKIYRQRHLHMDVLQHMIQSPRCNLAAVNSEHETLLMQACKDEAVNVVGKLVEVRKDIGINLCDKLGRSAVYILCENLGKANNKSLTLLSMLMRSHQAGKLNMEVGYKGTTPLHLASKHDSQMMCNLLLCPSKKLVNSTDSLGRTPLHLAASKDIVKFLIRFGADIHKKDYLGQTPLSYSCQRGNREVAATLLDMQPDVSKSNDLMGRTILHHCTISNSLQELEGVSELPINTADIHQLSPLHYACISGDEDRTQRLLEMGADTNLEDRNKLSPLHLASTSQCYDLLVRNKTDTTLTSCLGCSPTDMQQWYAERQRKEPGKLSSDIKERGSTAIAKIINTPLLGFMERNEQNHIEFRQLVQVLRQFMTKLNEEIRAIDPLLESEVVLHGSPHDGTVVGTPDELNFVFVLTKIADILETPTKSVYSSAYTTLNLRSDFHGHRPDFVDADGSVMVPVLCHAFHSAVQRAFGSPNVWSDSLQLYSDPNSTSKHTATTNPNIANSKRDEPADTLRLVFHGKVFKWLPVAVRIVPAIRFANWWPAWLPHRRIPDGSVAYLLAQESPNTPPQKQPYLFLVDCRDAEDKLIRDLPSTALKHGFSLAKLMRQPEICTPLKTTDGEFRDTDPATGYISEEMLRTIALFLSEEEEEDRATKPVRGRAIDVSKEGAMTSESCAKPAEKTSIDPDTEASIKYARLIYERLATALHTSLMSYFVPTYDVFKAHFQHLNQSEINSKKVAKAYCQEIQNLLA